MLSNTMFFSKLIARTTKVGTIFSNKVRQCGREICPLIFRGRIDRRKMDVTNFVVVYQETQRCVMDDMEKGIVLIRN